AARNLCDVDDGVLTQGRKLIVDRDAKYSYDWRSFIEEQGVEVVRLPPKSPNLNAYAKRFVRSIQEACLDRMIFIGQASGGRSVHGALPHREESPGLGQSAHRSRTARSLIAPHG